VYRFIISFLIICQVSSISYACQCGERSTIIDNWALADHVFIGEVIDIDSTENISSYGRNVILFNIQVIESFKYDIEVNNNMRTFIYVDESSCDYYFKPGRSYLIYANNIANDIFLISNYCSRTNLLINVNETEIEKLRELRAEFLKDDSNSHNVSFNKSNDTEVALLKTSYDKIKKEKRIVILISTIIVALLIVGLITLWRGTSVKKTLTIIGGSDYINKLEAQCNIS